jgi:hypothetical protein
MRFLEGFAQVVESVGELGDDTTRQELLISAGSR